jgi:RNA polymerase sigma-70 factor (ECF subfamily)
VSHSEEKLLDQIESLYRDGFADFVAVAASIVGERESAREAVQDAFASIVRSRRDFRGEAPLEAWVWRAVINAARKKKRHYSREAHARATAPVMNGTEPDRDEGSELATLVAALPERQRLVLFLRYYADLDYLRIAQILGVRTGTVSASLHAAHRTLRQAQPLLERRLRHDAVHHLRPRPPLEPGRHSQGAVRRLYGHRDIRSLVERRTRHS